MSRLLVIVTLGAFLSQGHVHPQSYPPGESSHPSATVSADMMYQLGQQDGQVRTLAVRLEHIESKLDIVNDRVVWITAVGTVIAIVFSVIIGPILVEAVRRRFFCGQPLTTD